MPPEVYVVCPRCGHRYNVHASVYGQGPDFPMFCPLCNATFPRSEADAAGSGRGGGRIGDPRRE